jgi:hypothetical protein
MNMKEILGNELVKKVPDWNSKETLQSQGINILRSHVW